MKNLHKGLLFAIITVSLVICIVNCSGSSPSKVVRAFFAAAEKGDVKAMQDLSTAETASLIGMFSSKIVESLKEGEPADSKITGTSEKITGDTAEVTVTFASGKTEDITLKKVDGKWKIHADMNK